MTDRQVCSVQGKHRNRREELMGSMHVLGHVRDQGALVGKKASRKMSTGLDVR